MQLHAACEGMAKGGSYEQKGILKLARTPKETKASGGDVTKDAIK